MLDRGTSDAIIARLKEKYPAAECALQFDDDPWRLLVMAILSAQCTDARVNLVSVDLFARFPNVYAMAQGELNEIEELIRSCGLYKNKAKNIKNACIAIAEKHDGQVPDTMEGLLSLAGVGRKIANLMLGDVFGKPGIVTDTHCIRLGGRMGYYPESEKNPLKIERILDKIIPPEEQSAFCHRLVWFGREVCTARAPKCSECPLADLCEKGKTI
jgi:endonuclease-3